MNAAMFLKIWGWIKWLVTFGKAAKPVIKQAHATVTQIKAQMESLKQANPRPGGMFVFEPMIPQETYVEDVGEATRRMYEATEFPNVTVLTDEPPTREEIEQAVGQLYDEAHAQMFKILQAGSFHPEVEAPDAALRERLLNMQYAKHFPLTEEAVDAVITDANITMANFQKDVNVGQLRAAAVSSLNGYEEEALEHPVKPVDYGQVSPRMADQMLNQLTIKPTVESDREDYHVSLDDLRKAARSLEKNIVEPRFPIIDPEQWKESLEKGFLINSFGEEKDPIEEGLVSGELEVVTVMAQEPYGAEAANKQSVDAQDNEESIHEKLEPFPPLEGTLPPEFWEKEVKLKEEPAPNKTEWGKMPMRIQRAKEVLETLPRPEPIVVNGRPTHPEEDIPIQVGEAPAVFDPDSGTWKFILVILDREQQRLMKLNNNSLLTEVQTSAIRGQIAYCERLAALPKLLKDGRI